VIADFVDDDGIDLERPVRIHVVIEKRADELHFDFSGSADETKGPANIRPPLVQAACAYALISLVDPNMYVSSGLIRGFTMTARDGSVLNPRFPAPVNTYNPTIHALVDAIFDAMSHVVPSKVRADGSGSRSIILGGRNTYTGKGYVQYEILAGGAGARASKDGASGITVNQSNAKIAPVEIIESEFPTRLTRFELIVDSGGAGEFRGGLGIRREYLNLADARFSIRSMKHLIPPNGCAGGGNGRRGDLWINPDSRAAKRLPTRYADYPLRAGDIFRLDTPGGGGHGDPLARDAERVLADVREGLVSSEAAERDYGVMLEPAAGSWVIDRTATQANRSFRSDHVTTTPFLAKKQGRAEHGPSCFVIRISDLSPASVLRAAGVCARARAARYGKWCRVRPGSRAQCVRRARAQCAGRSSSPGRCLSFWWCRMVQRCG